MPGYNWKVFDDTDEVEDIVSAGAKGGFILTGRYTYTYVVNDLSILDSLDSEFSEIYTDYWQEQELRPRASTRLPWRKFWVTAVFLI